MRLWTCSSKLRSTLTMAEGFHSKHAARFGLRHVRHLRCWRISVCVCEHQVAARWCQRCTGAVDVVGAFREQIIFNQSTPTQISSELAFYARRIVSSCRDCMTTFELVGIGMPTV